MGPLQWRIQDFPEGGYANSQNGIIFKLLAEKCMKMKEFGPPVACSWRPLPPWIRQCTDTPVLDFWQYICSGFRSQGGSPRLHTSSPACNGFLRFTSVVTPADLLVAELFQSMYLYMCTQALIGILLGIECVLIV